MNYRSELDIRIKLNSSSSPVIKRNQFQLVLAWACSIHKVQDLSLTHIVASFALLKQRIFNYGQIYFALSRITSFDGLYIIGSFTINATGADRGALKKYNRMLYESMLVTGKRNVTDKQVLLITLPHFRFLNKHDADSACDERIK